MTPPPSAREHLGRMVESLREAPGAPRWTAPERWHLTLLFLGAVPADRVRPLLDRLGGATAGTPVLTLWLAGGGRFGSRRRPSVAWAGLAGDVAPLTDLAGRLATAARALRLPVEDRPFRPHLTLGRWRPGDRADGDLMDRMAGYRGPEWSVRQVELLESHLGPKPRHDLVAAWPVGV